jgi:predicted acylesterase/phospholipase RssA
VHPSAASLAEALASHGIKDLPARALDPGDVLVTEGDHSREAFWVETGILEVRAPDGTVLAAVGPQRLVGEFTALTGGRRTATLVAATATAVRVIPDTLLDDVLATDPALAASVRATAVERIEHTRVAEAVERLLGRADPALVERLLQEGNLERLASGERLVEIGDPAARGYLLVTGRVRGAAPGTLLGAEALVPGATHRVAIDATRDALLLALPPATLEHLLAAAPSAVLPSLLDPRPREAAGPRGRLVTVTVATRRAPADLLDRLTAALASSGTVTRLSSARVDAMLGRPGVAQASADEPGDLRLRDLLDETERHHDLVVLEPDPTPTAWTDRALRACDVLVLVVPPDPDEDEAATAGAALASAGPGTLRLLVIAQPPGIDRPRGTAALAARWACDHVLHLRGVAADDLGRLARFVTGRPLALVLGGGGARGFAAIGVYRALTELGLAVDAVAATSIGSPLGGGIAQGLDPDGVTDAAARLFHDLLDYTVPVVALLKGERTATAIDAQFHGWDVEDLLLPYVAVSTDLTLGRQVLHRHGDLVTAVRASVAIPGVFPPVPSGESLLVDGGVTNNLPADVARRLLPDATVVAVEAAPLRGPRAKADYGLSVSGWRALRGSLGGQHRYPGVVAVLMRSMITGSMAARDATVARGDADLVLDVDLRGVGMLDFERVPEVAARGYEETMPRLTAWLDAGSA